MSLETIGVQEVKTEILVIGSEAAGGKAAIEAKKSDADVLVVTKGLMGRSGNTVMAGRGIQAPIGHADTRDNPGVFFEDVIKGGVYLNNQKLVERLVNIAVTEVPKMAEWGAQFLKRGDKFVQYYSPGATYPRSLLPVGHGGLQWRTALVSQFKLLKIKIMEDVFITSLLLSNGQVAGALGISIRDGRFIVFRSKNTILATGGCPQVYRMTDASHDATGDGMEIAYNAGAELMDMEFQQFFPLACYTPPFEMAPFPASLRYFLHGKFYNSAGESFMERYIPIAKGWGLRAPTARAIYLENMYGRGSPHGGAYIAVNHLPENLISDWIERERPAFLAKLEKVGIDIRKHALECGPACHYSMGGVKVNENCETTLPRLYAIGEVASGPDGAERIDAGPAITWCLTMGYIAGKDAAKKARVLNLLDIDFQQIDTEQKRVNLLRKRKEGIRGIEIKNKIKDIMWKYCSLVRNREGLEEGLSLIQKIRKNDLPQVCVPDPSPVFNKGFIEALESINLANLSEMITKAALMRGESRGSHYRADFTERDDKNWLKNIVIKKEQGKMKFTIVPTMITKMKPSENGNI